MGGWDGLGELPSAIAHKEERCLPPEAGLRRELSIARTLIGWVQSKIRS